MLGIMLLFSFRIAEILSKQKNNQINFLIESVIVKCLRIETGGTFQLHRQR